MRTEIEKGAKRPNVMELVAIATGLRKERTTLASAADHEVDDTGHDIDPNDHVQGKDIHGKAVKGVVVSVDRTHHIVKVKDASGAIHDCKPKDLHDADKH